MKDKSKKTLKKVFAIAVMIILGFGLGFGLVYIMDVTMEGDFSLPSLIAIFLLLFLAYFLNVITHEAGHLLMGLLTGYRFLSFRVLSWILIRDSNGRYSVKKFSLPGTLGQCLLIPPELDEKEMMPNVLYNLGGVCANFLNAALSALLYFTIPMNSFLSSFVLMYGVIGLLQGLENGIPMGGLGINNDGANIVALKRNPRAVKALFKQLMINAYQTEGMLFEEMPKELFVMPELAEMNDNIVSAEGVFVENFYMEKMNHESTLSVIDFLLDRPEIKLLDIYRILLESDKILLKLLLGKAVELDKATRKNLQQFSVLPNVLVTTYAVAKLYDRDEKNADKIEARFMKMMKTYPFRCDRETLPKYMNEIKLKALEK